MSATATPQSTTCALCQAIVLQGPLREPHNGSRRVASLMKKNPHTAKSVTPQRGGIQLRGIRDISSPRAGSRAMTGYASGRE